MRYKHNCTDCQELGICENYDLYICGTSCQHGDNATTLIARYSDVDSDYISGFYGITDFALLEARRRALEREYLTTKDNFSYTFNHPDYTPTLVSIEDCDISPEATADCNAPDTYNTPNISLKQYMKDKTGKRYGLVKTYKIDIDDFNTDYCINGGYNVSKPFILITHSKVNPNSSDVFNVDKAYHICDSRAKYMLRVLSGQIQPRAKTIMNMPSTKILNYYNDMYERARRYYKDCDVIHNYYSSFVYQNNKEQIQKNKDYVTDNFNFGNYPSNLFTSTKCSVNT